MIIMIMFITLPVDYYITGRFITLMVDLLHYQSIITSQVVTGDPRLSASMVVVVVVVVMMVVVVVVVVSAAAMMMMMVLVMVMIMCQ